MATKAELLDQAKTQGIEVPEKATKADLEALLNTETDQDGHPRTEGKTYGVAE